MREDSRIFFANTLRHLLVVKMFILKYIVTSSPVCRLPKETP